MVKWIFNRVADILLALLVMTVVLWYVLTQPMLSFSFQRAEQLGLDRYALELGLRELLAIPASTEDAQNRFAATSLYLSEQLAGIGPIEQIDRGEGQKVLRLKVGQGGKQRLFVALHYVVTDKPILEMAESAVSLIELAKAINKEPEVAVQLNLSIFLHHPDQLGQSLNEISAYHVDQLVQSQVEGSPVLVFMPGLRVPDAAYISGLWRYFNVLIPSDNNDVALFGRLNDVGLIRGLKHSLRSFGLSDVQSLTIPVNFPDMKASPLKFYWDAGQPAMLMRPNILLHDKNYDGHVRFISALFGVVKTGY